MHAVHLDWFFKIWGWGPGEGKNKVNKLSSSWDGRLFGHNRHVQKNWEGCAPLGWELDPHLTQCRLGRGLPLYQVVSWCIQPFGHNRHRPKIGGCTPFGGSWVPI